MSDFFCFWYFAAFFNLVPFGWGYAADIERRAALLHQPNNATRTADPGGDISRGLILATLLRWCHIPWSTPWITWSALFHGARLARSWRPWGPRWLGRGECLNEYRDSLCGWLRGCPAACCESLHVIPFSMIAVQCSACQNHPTTAVIKEWGDVNCIENPWLRGIIDLAPKVLYWHLPSW